jgi:hypothetical protein
MSFNYKNPLTPLTALGNISTKRDDVFGTHFSILSTGGYMEVYSLDDLNYTIPSGATGLIKFSGNTIPIQFNKGNGSPFSFDVLTLNSDNFSSGRRRIGMLVYVKEVDQVYQYQVPNFDVYWPQITGATGPGGPTTIFSNFGTTIKNNNMFGQWFIDEWTSSKIEGISGNTRSDSNWIKYYGTTLAVTGGTFDNITNILTLNNITGGSINISGFTSFTGGSGSCISEIYVNDIYSCLSAITVNNELIVLSGITLTENLVPSSDAQYDIGTPIKRFRQINTVSGTSSVWTSTTKIITPEVDLGLDSFGNSRVLNADSSVLNNDILSGGTF